MTLPFVRIVTGVAIGLYIGMASLFAQQASTAYPLLREDRHIVFRVEAPEADEVQIRFQEAAQLNLYPKDLMLTPIDSGIWELVLKPLPPGMYRYQINKEGYFQKDPKNLATYINRKGVWSVLTVPVYLDDDYYQPDASIKAGQVQNRVYQSSTLGTPRTVNVYLPPDYTKRPSSPYPVLYLLHDRDEGVNAWYGHGKINYLMDHLIAKKVIPPTIVVMPDCHVMARQGTIEDAARILKADFVSGLFPAVERWYPVSEQRQDTFIAGVRLGAQQALHLGLNFPGKFAQVGVLGYHFPGLAPVDQQLLETYQAEGPAFQRLFVAETSNNEEGQSLHQLFNRQNIGHDHFMMGGMTPNWVIWRHIFYREFAPGLFNASH